MIRETLSVLAQQVLAGVNRAVVYQNRIDITDDILRKINPQISDRTINGPRIPGQR